MSEYVKIKLPRNPWAISTILLALIIVGFVILYFRGNLLYSGKDIISQNQAGLNAVNFINSQTNNSVQLKNTSEISGIYKIYVVYNGQSLPIYSTKDGKYLLQGIIPVN